MSSDLEEFTSEEIKNCPIDTILKYFQEKYDEENASLLLEKLNENYSFSSDLQCMIEDISLSSKEIVISVLQSSEIPNMEICSLLII